MLEVPVPAEIPEDKTKFPPASVVLLVPPAATVKLPPAAVELVSSQILRAAAPLNERSLVGVVVPKPTLVAVVPSTMTPLVALAVESRVRGSLAAVPP